MGVFIDLYVSEDPAKFVYSVVFQMLLHRIETNTLCALDFGIFDSLNALYEELANSDREGRRACCHVRLVPVAYGVR